MSGGVVDASLNVVQQHSRLDIGWQQGPRLDRKDRYQGPDNLYRYNDYHRHVPVISQSRPTTKTSKHPQRYPLEGTQRNVTLEETTVVAGQSSLHNNTPQLNQGHDLRPSRKSSYPALLHHCRLQTIWLTNRVCGQHQIVPYHEVSSPMGDDEDKGEGGDEDMSLPHRAAEYPPQDGY